MISSVIETIVSVHRLFEFLHAEELQQDATQRNDKNSLSMDDEVLPINGRGVHVDEEQCQASA